MGMYCHFIIRESPLNIWYTLCAVRLSGLKGEIQFFDEMAVGRRGAFHYLQSDTRVCFLSVISASRSSPAQDEDALCELMYPCSQTRRREAQGRSDGPCS